MTNAADVRKTAEKLKKHGQEHLLRFWDDLDEPDRKALLDQITDLDIEQVSRWIQEYVLKPTTVDAKSEPSPAEFYPIRPHDQKQRAEYEDAIRLGRELLHAGKVGAFVVAGGQGTRLGFDGPKGNFPITPVRGRTLFQVFAEYILAARKRYDAPCPWYIMTSPLNHRETVEILESNGYYGLPAEDVIVFQQGTMPNFGFDGRILMAEKGKIAASPDGHGGSLRALHRSGALADMRKRGIEHLSYWQVDNSFVNIFDPLFIGLHAKAGAEMSSRTVIKNSPHEKVGNFCLVDGKMTVIEYSDLPDELAEAKEADGTLRFELGSIAIHIIERAFVERLNEHGFSLPWHRAVKKIPYIDADGRYVEPSKPNGVKLESFIFDALPLAQGSIILETLRESEFAPTKNATGVDSAESARQMTVERAADWLESAGVNVPRKADGTPDCLLEIAPSFALYKDDMRAKAGEIPTIRPGDTVYLV